MGFVYFKNSFVCASQTADVEDRSGHSLEVNCTLLGEATLPFIFLPLS